MANRTIAGTMPFAEFVAGVEPATRRDEALVLDAVFREVTGFEPAIWGPSLVGYGRYAYRYGSGRTGESLAAGFSPRKAELVIYGMPGFAEVPALLAALGPYRIGKSCLYLKRLDTANLAVLARLIRAGLDDLARHWPITP